LNGGGGGLFACDLSAESIKIAKETYKQYPNCEFHALDASDFVLDRQFDMVIMPDSCEHIPVEQHNRMFKNISKMLKDDGIVYIHIPHPYHLDWMRIHDKEELQLIDQSLYLHEFCETIKDTDFYVFSEEPYNIWIFPNLSEWRGKYVHRVLRRKEDFSNMTNALTGQNE
jgi:cyclopropane fatty-acyl-phospholipid synthase-like methyltransferase